MLRGVPCRTQVPSSQTDRGPQVVVNDKGGEFAVRAECSAEDCPGRKEGLALSLPRVHESFLIQPRFGVLSLTANWVYVAARAYPNQLSASCQPEPLRSSPIALP